MENHDGFREKLSLHQSLDVLDVDVTERTPQAFARHRTTVPEFKIGPRRPSRYETNVGSAVQELLAKRFNGSNEFGLSR